MEKILERLRQKENLTFDESKSAFELLMTGKASDCLLYTSPSPRDRTTSRMPSSA